MKTKTLFISIVLLLSVISVNAQNQETAYCEEISNNKAITDVYSELYFVPVVRLEYTPLEKPRNIFGHVMFFEQEQVLYHKGDTSCNWIALNSVRPDLIEKFHIPPWSLTYKKIWDIYEYAGTGEFMNIMRNTHPTKHTEEAKYCERCGGKFIQNFDVRRYTNEESYHKSMRK